MKSGQVGKNSFYLSRSFTEAALGYLFLAPSLILFGVFILYPLIRSVYLSLHLTNPRGEIATFVGLDNFKALLMDGGFLKSLLVTGLFTLYTVPAGMLVAMLLAALTFQRLKGKRIYQFLFSLPIAIPVGAASVIWLLLFHPSAGMINYLLSLAGIAPVAWLTDTSWALVSVSLVTIWMHLGFNFIVMLGGLMGVPQDILESAKIDGSSPLRTFWQILVPLLSPTLFFIGIVSVIGSFQAFGQIHILTKGGPAHATEVVVFSIYREAFMNFQFGTASAQALVLFVLILLLTLVQFVVLERKVHYQ